MLIVDRESFLSFPVGTVFCRYEQSLLGNGEPRGTKGLAIKGETRGTDFFVTDLFLERDDSEKKLEESNIWITNRVTPPVDFETEVLDELPIGRQHFAVFSILEAELLIIRLQKAVEDQKVPA